MNNYYKRSSVPVSRSNKVVENDKRKIKNRYKFGVSFGVSLITLIVAMLGYDYYMVLVPALIGMSLLLGSVEKDTNPFVYLLPFAFGMPVLCGIINHLSLMEILLQIAILDIAVILAVNYRPFLWKRTVMFGDLPLWYFILFAGVTNTGVGTVLILSVIVKTIISAIMTIGIILAVRVLLTGEEINKWTTQD